MYKNHGEFTSTGAIIGTRQRIHYTYQDNVEMVEEYDINSDNLLVRKWKSKNIIGTTSKWEYEIGQDNNIMEMESNSKDIGITLNNNNPIFITKDKKNAFEWRIRNLYDSKDNYCLSIDDKKQEIIIRTKNKKYYKRFRVPFLVRLDLKLDEKKLHFNYENNTLIIHYEKPKEVIKEENENASRRKQPKNSLSGSDADKCAQQ